MQATSYLQAVNQMLSMIGSSPVSSLTGSTSADAAVAQDILSEVSREVQSAGWHFNTEYEVELTPDATTSYIELSPSILRVDVEPEHAGELDCVQRGLKLYDRKGHTFNFSESVKATVVYALDWDSLPQPARHYIATRAGRVFCDRMIGEGDQHSFNMLQEVQALASLRNFEAQTGDHSIFDAYDTFRIVNRMGSPNNY